MKLKPGFTSLFAFALVIFCVLGCSKTGNVASPAPAPNANNSAPGPRRRRRILPASIRLPERTKMAVLTKANCKYSSTATFISFAGTLVNNTTASAFPTATWSR